MWLPGSHTHGFLMQEADQPHALLSNFGSYNSGLSGKLPEAQAGLRRLLRPSAASDGDLAVTRICQSRLEAGHAQQANYRLCFQQFQGPGRACRPFELCRGGCLWNLIAANKRLLREDAVLFSKQAKKSWAGRAALNMSCRLIDRSSMRQQKLGILGTTLQHAGKSAYLRYRIPVLVLRSHAF